MDGCTDGICMAGDEVFPFACKYSRAFFCPVTALHPDQRGSQYASNTPPLYQEP